MIKILFLCHGNICRSTMAEFIFKDMVKKENLEKEIYVESAGTSVFDVGSPVYPNAKECLYNHGIKNKDINNKFSRQVEKSDYDEFDYLLVAEDDNLRGLDRIVGEDIDNKIFKILYFAKDTDRENEDIADPWYTRNFEITYKDIVLGCEGLIKYLKNII